MCEQAFTPENVIAGEACEFFGLGAPSLVEPVGKGKASSNYFVKTLQGGEYVMRIMGEYDLQVHANELAAQAQLARSGLVTNAMIPARDTQTHIYDRGDAMITMSRKIEGSHISAESMDAGHCESIGGAIASFHLAVNKVPHQNERRLLDPRQVEQRWIRTELPDETNGVVAEMLAARRLLIEGDLPTGACHGDVYADNVYFTTGGEVALLDVEHVSEDFLIMDLARAAVDICQEDGKINGEKLVAMIEGYDRKRPLLYRETVRIQEAMAYSAAAVALWLIEHNEPAIAGQFLRVGTDLIS